MSFLFWASLLTGLGSSLGLMTGTAAQIPQGIKNFLNNLKKYIINKCECNEKFNYIIYIQLNSLNNQQQTERF